MKRRPAIRYFLALTRTAPNFHVFESFLMLSNVSKLLCDQLLMILLVQLVSDMSLHQVICIFISRRYTENFPMQRTVNLKSM